jgi:hypothetical protein
MFGSRFVFFFDKNKHYSFFDTFFIGLSLVGTLLNFWSLFFPTNHFSLLFLLLTSMFFFYKESNFYKHYFFEIKNKLTNNKGLLLLILCGLIIILLFSAVSPKLYDTYLYHINAIQWNEKYKVVPGLANLHDRFGFNSSVFVLSSSFSFIYIYEQYLFIINSLSYFIFFAWILKSVVEFKNLYSLFLLLFLYYFTNHYYSDISSPGTDLLPNIFICYLLINALLFEEYLKEKWLLFLVLPLFCVTLKLSTLPIIILSCLLVVFVKNKNTLFFNSKRFLFFALLFTLPWIIRNVITTGYVLFPVTIIDIFNFDWKVPVENVNILQDWIYSWARIPFKDSKEVLNMGFIEWFSVWWDKLLIINKRLFILAIISPFIYLFYSFFKKDVRKKLIPISIAFIIMILWLLTAPDIRFSFSAILFLALSPMILMPMKVLKFFEMKFLMYILSFYTLFLIYQKAITLFKEDYEIKNLSEYYYLPMDVSIIKEKRNIKYNSKVFNSEKNIINIFEPNPTHSQCFDKFPCSWYIDSNLKLRGDELSDGFLYIKE